MSSVDPGLHYPIDLDSLPRRWRVCYVGDAIADIQPGFASGVHNQEGKGIPHLRPMNVDREGRMDLSVVKYVANANGPRLRRGDVLFNNTNSPELIGKTTTVESDEELAFSNHMTRLRPPQGIHGRFVAHQLHFLWRSGYFKHRCVKHVNQASIASSRLAKSIPLILPPLDEQRLIVAEIEKQFTRLEAGVVGLRRVQANLKRYRAAVLKAACEGKLVPTEAEVAREREKVAAAFRRCASGESQSRDGSATQEGRSYETGDQLLERILTDRRQKWKGKGKYKEPVNPDAENLPALREGWTWASLDQLQNLLKNGISKKPDAEVGLPILRISAVRPMSVNVSDTRYLKAHANEYSEFSLSEGDLLFTRYNGNPDLVGVCGVVPKLSSQVVHPDKLIRCKLASEELLPKFVGIMANVGASREFLAKRVRTTAGQSGISGGDLRALPIPVAPFTEQQRIVAEVERRLSVVEELETVVNANLQRAIRLRQSILQRAFSGTLT